MAKKDYITIQLPEWEGWRVAGSERDWQIQRLVDGNNGEQWRGTNFWPSAEYAIMAAYERTLRECGKEFASLKAFVDECRRVKAELVKAVRKAVGE